MRLLSAILGSSAALTTLAPAFAADAVMMPEPEPVEYVRICDVYGKGFFYIPGTETCLRVSGYVRYEIGTSSENSVFDTPNYNEFANGWDKTVRGRINVDARSETEFGTLRSFIRFQASWNGVGDGAVRADQVWLSLGGFRMGYTESLWADSVVGKVNTQGSHSDNGMSYGDQQRALIQYNFSNNGFFGSLSLEDDTLAGEGYMPDVVGLVGYSAGWGGVWGRIGYDESFGNIAGVNGGFGASIGAEFNIPNMEGSSLRLVGYWSDGDHQYGVLNPSAEAVFGGNGNSEWSILASYGHTFTDKFSGSVGFQYFNNYYLANSDVATTLDGYSAEVSLVYLPVKDFEVRTEVTYDKIDGLDGSVSGYLRFQRNF
ncbi:MAG: porin [Mesorhizobium sp.]